MSVFVGWVLVLGAGIVVLMDSYEDSDVRTKWKWSTYRTYGIVCRARAVVIVVLDGHTL